MRALSLGSHAEELRASMLRSYAEESRASAAAGFIDVVVAVVVALVAFVDVVVAVVVAFALHDNSSLARPRARFDVPAGAHESSLDVDGDGDGDGVDNVGDGSFPHEPPP